MPALIKRPSRHHLTRHRRSTWRPFRTLYRAMAADDRRAGGRPPAKRAPGTLVTEMSRRRTALFLCLVAALTAISLSAGLSGAPDRSRDTDPSAQTAFTARLVQADGVLSRLTTDERRDAASERGPKQRLMLAAVLAALVCTLLAARRRLVVVSGAGRPAVSRWSPQAGRSPPLLRSIV